MATQQRGFSPHGNCTCYIPEKWFMVCSLSFVFFFGLEASVVKSVASSLFLTAYSNKLLPWAWFFGVFVNYWIVALYNYLLPIFGCRKMFLITTSLEISFLIFSTFLIHLIYWLPFVLYFWKDISILLFFHQMWSLIHATISSSKAKIFYCFLCGTNGIGSVIGGIVVSHLASIFGSQYLLFVCIFSMLMMTIFFSMGMAARVKINIKQNLLFQPKNLSFFYNCKVIRNSKLLQLIAYMVFVLQCGSTLLDYKFNVLIEHKFPVQDSRTAFLGKFFGIVNGCSVIMQFMGGVLFRWIGLKNILLGLSGILTCCSCICFNRCTFFCLALFYGNIKSFDYSLFTLTKEMMYIPLPVDDKFHGKVVIDVFIYRFAKVFASLVIFCFGYVNVFFPSHLEHWMFGLVMGLFFSWFLAVFFMFHYYDQEMLQKHWDGVSE